MSDTEASARSYSPPGTLLGALERGRYERPGCLRALHAMAPERTALVLGESLWDCESDARLYAVHHASDSPELTLRLAELRDSPVEDDELREAAAGRLG
ncbi:hypothetical protein ACFV6F_26895 [Kitasatospora phosalacinea]|uniref:hypothetical protein n=1 Tax=Kitasatospora phosalacinea TaxID=2065 RepID=UPI0036678DB9